MSEVTFSYLRSFIREHSAIVLEADKDYLIETRLTSLAKEFGFQTVSELIQELKSNPNSPLKHRIIDAMTTNETLFFRDLKPFELFKNHILPELLLKNKPLKKLNIWCAASSSGQEPYTIAMLLKDHEEELRGWTVNFIASDLSEKILRKAQDGVYNQMEVNRGLPLSYLVKYFEKINSEWHLKDEIKQIVQFEKINLLGQWNHEDLDLIFMRNVLIYFDLETKKKIVERVYNSLGKRGYLFLGGAETLLGITDVFNQIRIDKTCCYQKKTKEGAD
jgi:chemotaxis protein methyltransferase CheR